MAERQTLTIASYDDLGLLGPYSRRSMRNVGTVRLALPGLPDAEKRAREDRVNRLFFACGCVEATILGLVGALGAALWAGLREESLAGGGVAGVLAAIGIVILVFFLATGVGKYLGLKIAEARMRREIHELRAFAPPSASLAEPVSCGHH